MFLRVLFRLRFCLSGGVGVGWLSICAVVAMLVLLPVLSLTAHALQGSGELLPHLLEYVLPRALRDSLLLLGGVGAMVVVLGSGLAWLVTAYDFPARRVLAWALLLPLAVPTYIVAFAYLDLWHPVGALQTGLRALLGYDGPRELRLPDIRSMGGCILLLGLVLYPYVYLPARALFQMQAGGLIDASRTLGAGPWRTFLRVALPLARPAIAVGASLALMEALNDIGASEFLGVRTFTVSIYATWVSRSSLSGAAQIALCMLAVVLSLIALERWARRHQQYVAGGRQVTPLAPRRLGTARGLLALVLCCLPVGLGFALPAGYLIVEAAKRVGFAGLEQMILREAMNTIAVAAVATAVATILAFVLACTVRQGRAPLPRLLVRCASLGYALPGTVLAIGLLGPLAWFDNAFGSVAQQFFGLSAGLLLSGSTAALIYAYVARFLAVSSGGIEAGFSKIPHSLDDAARSLGAGATGVATRIHLPLSMPPAEPESRTSEPSATAVVAASQQVVPAVTEDPTPVTTLAENLAEQAAPAMAALIGHVTELAATAQSLEALRDQLLQAYGDLPGEQLTAVMSAGFAVAELAGMDDVERGE